MFTDGLRASWALSARISRMDHIPGMSGAPTGVKEDSGLMDSKGMLSTCTILGVSYVRTLGALSSTYAPMPILTDRG